MASTTEPSPPTTNPAPNSRVRRWSGLGMRNDRTSTARPNPATSSPRSSFTASSPIAASTTCHQRPWPCRTAENRSSRTAVERWCEGDLVEAEVGGLRERPGQRVGDGHAVRRPGTQLPAGDDPQWRNRRREQRRLRDEQRLRPGVEPVERGEQSEDRGEVVAEHGEVRAEPVVHLHDRHRQPEMAVGPHRLVEDHQVVGAGAEGVVLQQSGGRAEPRGQDADDRDADSVARPDRARGAR